MAELRSAWQFQAGTHLACGARRLGGTTEQAPLPLRAVRCRLWRWTGRSWRWRSSTATGRWSSTSTPRGACTGLPRARASKGRRSSAAPAGGGCGLGRRRSEALGFYIRGCAFGCAAEEGSHCFAACGSVAAAGGQRILPGHPAEGVRSWRVAIAPANAMHRLCLMRRRCGPCLLLAKELETVRGVGGEG